LLKVVLCISVAAALLPISLSAQTNTGAIPSTYFGLSMHTGVLYVGQGWPQVKLGSARLWETGTGWGDINTSPGAYDWTTLDRWLAKSQTVNIPLFYTFGTTPQWASSNPADTACAKGPGSCDAPSDLNPDGTGTNQHWKDFVRALATHVAGQITYWQMWNTPNDIRQWTGTPQQLVRMTKDARSIILSIDPNAKIIAPPSGNYHCKLPATCHAAKWIGMFLAAGGGPYVDLISFHTYFTQTPEDVLLMLNCIRTTLITYAQNSKPIWATEGSWGAVVDLPDSDAQAAYLARTYLLLWPNGVERFYWYAWDDPNWGILFDRTAGLHKAGTAYAQVQNWLVGRTMVSPCTQSSVGVWGCTLTGAGGYQARVLWNPGGNRSYTVKSQYLHSRDLSGRITAVPANGVVTLGAKPLLFENK
jgi:hypothetical protein